MYGRAGSDTTGPGPFGGGMNSSSWSCQPVTLLGAKFGTLAVSVATAGLAKFRTSAPIVETPPKANFDAGTDSLTSCSRDDSLLTSGTAPFRQPVPQCCEQLD